MHSFFLNKIMLILNMLHILGCEKQQMNFKLKEMNLK